jgi:hypothetical protein
MALTSSIASWNQTLASAAPLSTLGSNPLNISVPSDALSCQSVLYSFWSQYSTYPYNETLRSTVTGRPYTFCSTTTSSYTGPVTTLCDGYPRAAGDAPTSVLCEPSSNISIVPALPPPCVIDENGCTALWSSYTAVKYAYTYLGNPYSLTDAWFLPTPYCTLSNPQCGPCGIGAGQVQLY